MHRLSLNAHTTIKNDTESLILHQPTKHPSAQKKLLAERAVIIILPASATDSGRR